MQNANSFAVITNPLVKSKSSQALGMGEVERSSVLELTFQIHSYDTEANNETKCIEKNLSRDMIPLQNSLLHRSKNSCNKDARDVEAEAVLFLLKQKWYL